MWESIFVIGIFYMVSYGVDTMHISHILNHWHKLVLEALWKADDVDLQMLWVKLLTDKVLQ